MKSTIKRISIFILSAIIVGAVIVFVFRERIAARFIPAVEQFGEMHIQVKNDTSYLSSKLIITNRSFLKINIDSLKYKIKLFGKTYLQNRKFIGVILRGNGKDTIDFSLKIPYLSILKDLRAEKKKTDSASYSINVALQYSTVFGNAEFPINRSAKLKIPEPPELEVVNIKYKKVRWRSVLADAEIKIINHSSVSLSVRNVSYSVKIANEGKMKGDFNEPITINPDGITFIKIPLVINADNMGRTLFEILLNRDKYNYTLTLNAFLESRDPLKESFHVDLIKSGEMELKK